MKVYKTTQSDDDERQDIGFSATPKELSGLFSSPEEKKVQNFLMDLKIHVNNQYEILKNFENSFFRDPMRLSKPLIDRIFKGSLGKMKGILYHCGEASSSLARTSALKLIYKLLDYETNFSAESFIKVFTSLSQSEIRSMKLEMHINANDTSNLQAMKVVKLYLGANSNSSLGRLVHDDQKAIKVYNEWLRQSVPEQHGGQFHFSLEQHVSEELKSSERFKRVKSSIDIYAKGKLQGSQGLLQPSHIHLTGLNHDQQMSEEINASIMNGTQWKPSVLQKRARELRMKIEDEMDSESGWVKKYLKPHSQFSKRLTNVSTLSRMRMSTKVDPAQDVGVTFGNSHFYDQKLKSAKITVEVKECPEVVRDYLQEEKGRHLWDLNILNSGPLKHVLKKCQKFIQIAYACTEVDKYMQLVTFKSEAVRPSQQDPSVVGCYILQYDILNLQQFCKDKNVYSEFDGTILYKIEGSGDRQEERRYFAPIQEEEKDNKLKLRVKRERANSCSQNTKLTMFLQVRDNSEIFYALRSRDQFFQSLLEFVRVVENEEFQNIYEHYSNTDSQGIDSPSYHSSPSPSSPFKLVTNEAQLLPGEESEIVFKDFSAKSEDSDIK